MITEELILCPKCKAQFSNLNPPRLLTMCGHTFCDKCIKELIIKKNNKYKLICPLDKMPIQLQSASQNYFPKNLSVLNLVKKKLEYFLADNRISDIIKSDNQPFGSGQQLPNLESELQGLAHMCKSGQQLNQNINSREQQFISEICLLHEKPLQLVCIRQCQKICASCAIFGEHRGHPVKKINQVQQISKNTLQLLKQYNQKQTLSFKMLESKQIQHKFELMLKKKRHQLQKQINKKFKQLIDNVVYAEKKTISKLEKKIQQIKQKIKLSIKEKIDLKQKFKDWMQAIQSKITLINGDSEEQRFKTVLKCEGFLQTCQKNVNAINLIEAELFSENQKTIENLILNTNDQQLKKCLKSFCKLEDYNNSFLDFSNSRINFHHFHEEQSLLDNLHSQLQCSSIIKPNEQSQTKIRKNVSSIMRSDGFYLQNKINEAHQTVERVNRVKSINKQLISRSKCKQNNILKSSRILNNLSSNSKMFSAHNSLKWKQIPQKYESKIQAVLTGNVDILDLTNGQLGCVKVSMILQAIKDSSCTIAKLVRNRINDDCLIQCIPFLNNIVMLNISRNQLTQKSIEYILKARRQGAIKSLKSLMISQNKIVQRKHKDTFQQLKKLGINVCI